MPSQLDSPIGRVVFDAARGFFVLFLPERGVSSFKILPGHPEECVGLKSVEVGDRTETWLFCFDLQGSVLESDTFLGSYKCEGVEIL